jgi:hypothetical protein
VRVGGVFRKQMRPNWSGGGGDSETTDDSAYAAGPVISLYNCRTNGPFFESERLLKRCVVKLSVDEVDVFACRSQSNQRNLRCFSFINKINRSSFF